MNANELADELEQSALATHKSLEVATMLRQQQAEIEALKAEIVSIEKNTDYWADKANWIKKNEPVAWVMEEDFKKMEKGAVVQFVYRCQQFSMQDNKPKKQIALYTHPVKEQLTDEELYELLPVNLRADEEDAFIFARAILKKAQE